MKLKREFALREIAGDRLLVPTGKAALDMNGLLTINEVGAEIWNMLPEVESEEEIVRSLLEIYEIEEEVLRCDVKEFMDKLREYGIL